MRRGCCGCICLGNGAGSELQQGLWAVQHGVIRKDQGMTKCTVICPVVLTVGGLPLAMSLLGVGEPSVPRLT